MSFAIRQIVIVISYLVKITTKHNIYQTKSPPAIKLKGSLLTWHLTDEPLFFILILGTSEFDTKLRGT